MSQTILLLTDSGAFAGTERHMLDLAQGLIAAGRMVAIGCPDPSPLAERARAAGLSVINLPKRGAIDPRLVAEIAALLKSGKVDLIHAHNGRSALHAAAAKARSGRGQLVFTQHFLQPARVGRSGLKGFVSNALHHWSAGRIDHVIAISQAVANQAASRREVRPEKMTVVHNGMNPELSKRNGKDIRAELGIPVDRPLVFCAARLVPEKDIDILIRAMGRLTQRPVCLIAGEGSLKAQLQSQIDMADLSADVRLLGFRKDVADLMAACDIFVLPSRAEPFGLALLEAMAAGKPVIAANEGGPPEIIVNKENGLLFPAGDDGALANAISSLTTDPAKRITVGQAARKRQATIFSTDRMVAQIMAVYDRVTPHTPVSAAARRPAALASSQP